MARLTWDQLPTAVRERVTAILGSPVVAHSSHPAGHSPGTADRVVCEDGRVAFVKAVHAELNPDTPDLHRAEAAVMAALPPGLPVPGWIGGVEEDGWVALVSQHIENAAHPDLPWTEERFLPVLDQCLDLSARLTPSPVPGLARASEELGDMWRAFGRVSVAPPADLDPWLLPRLDALAEIAESHAELLDGDTLAHADLRSDNILIEPGGRAWFIDWPWAMRGAAWLDAALLTAEFAIDGPGPEAADRALRRVGQCQGVAPEVVAGTLLGLLGFWTEASRLSAPPGLPALRDHQRRCADGLVAWLRVTSLVETPLGGAGPGAGMGPDPGEMGCGA